MILKLGRANVDFPVAPAIHVAFYFLTSDSLEISQFLLRNGADMYEYVLPAKGNDSPRPSTSYLTAKGYPPALMFAIGLGREPTNAHAALVKQLHVTYSHIFNDSRLKEWIEATSNPPLLQICILARNFDMVYVMVSEFSEHLKDERDSKGLSALVLLDVN